VRRHRSMRRGSRGISLLALRERLPLVAKAASTQPRERQGEAHGSWEREKDMWMELRSCMA